MSSTKHLHRSCCLLSACLVALCAAGVPAGASGQGVSGDPPFDSLGPGATIIVESTREEPCPGAVLTEHDDGTFENGFAWTGGGVVPPDYGCFVEKFDDTGYVCGLRLMLTQIGGFIGQTLDAYVYDDAGNEPGAVLSITPDIHIEAPAWWPEISTHDLEIITTPITGVSFAGYWGNWPSGPNGWFIAVDENGPGGGRPMTNVAPGLGLPTGWQLVTAVWPRGNALGIGAWITQEPPTLVEPASWGSIKALYAR